MKIGILGSGSVGATLATGFVGRGHEVRMGARSATGARAAEWAKSAGDRASHGTFADAASFGEMLFNCTKGEASVDALRAAGEANLAGKVLVDVSNPLDFSKGMPPSLFIANTDSLGEAIQRAFPKLRVVKALNTVPAPLMVNPGKASGDHDLLVCGNGAGAKREVIELLKTAFGWKVAIDLGDITAARGSEAYLLLFLRLMGALRTHEFNIHVVRAG